MPFSLAFISLPAQLSLWWSDMLGSFRFFLFPLDLFYYFYRMNKKELKTDLMLIVAAILWGLGFVAQRDGMNYIGPFLYSAIRFGIGVLCLLPVYFLTRKQERKIKVEKKTHFNSRNDRWSFPFSCRKCTTGWS